MDSQQFRDAAKGAIDESASPDPLTHTRTVS